MATVSQRAVENPVPMKGFSRKEIIAQLDRILASPQISGSGVLADFLRFIVYEAIDGRGDDLKEYTIGIQALRRDADFNPQIDSIVRIHAGRLRRAVKEYYYELGSADPIVISIPKGSYQPSFEKKAATESSQAPDEQRPLVNGSRKQRELKEPMVASDDPHRNGHATEADLQQKATIAVLPFRCLGVDETLSNFCKGTSEYLSTALTSFSDFRVISYHHGSYVASQVTDIRQLGASLPARYLITGSTQLLKPMVRVFVQLTDSMTGDQLWAQMLERIYPVDELAKFQEAIVDKTLAGITGVNGPISRNELAAVQGQLAEANITYWYTRYSNSFDEKTLTTARTYYEGLLHKDPNNPQVLGFLSEILSGETLLPTTKDKSLERPIAYAKLAIKLDPSSQQGYQALAITFLLQRRKEECAQVLKQGLAVNPKSTDFQGGMGALLIFAGEFELGASVVRKAMELSPNLTWWQVFSLSYYHYHIGEYQEALYLINRMQIDIIWIPIIKAACYAELGRIEEARMIVEQLKAAYPGVDPTVPAVLNQFFYSEVIVTGLSAGLQKIK